MINATIVLEGGATRGVFTSGVLDYLMEQDTYLSTLLVFLQEHVMPWITCQNRLGVHETV